MVLDLLDKALFQVDRCSLLPGVLGGKMDVNEKAGQLLLEGCVTELILDRNYGIIETANGLEVYFHRDSVHENDYCQLTTGSIVRFSVALNILGPQATSVDLVSR